MTFSLKTIGPESIKLAYFPLPVSDSCFQRLPKDAAAHGQVTATVLSLSCLRIPGLALVRTTTLGPIITTNLDNITINQQAGGGDGGRKCTDS